MLKQILVQKQKEIRRLKEEIPRLYPLRGLPGPREFKTAISIPGRVGLIAEIKIASPSAGVIREDADPARIAGVYEEAGAAAVSVLTDRRFFRGDRGYIPLVKEAISLPVLRKDFILNKVQLIESRLWGADAVLLIARILPRRRLKGLLQDSKELGLAVLTEVHDRRDLRKALECRAEIIGINNRDLDSFRVDLKTTRRLAPFVPEKCVLVSESGVGSGKDIRALHRYGVQAVLVGSSIMKSNNIQGKVGELARGGEGFHGKGEDMRHNQS